MTEIKPDEINMGKLGMIYFLTINCDSEEDSVSKNKQIISNQKLRRLAEDRIRNLDERIKVAEREDYADIRDFGLKHRKHELQKLLDDAEKE